MSSPPQPPELNGPTASERSALLNTPGGLGPALGSFESESTNYPTAINRDYGSLPGYLDRPENQQRIYQTYSMRNSSLRPPRPKHSFRRRVSGSLLAPSGSSFTGSAPSTLPDKSYASQAPPPQDNALFFSFMGMVFFGIGNTIFSKLEMIPMANYPSFINLYGTFFYLPLSMLYLIPVMYFQHPSKITPKQRSIPKIKFAIMGTMDMASSVMSQYAVTYLTSPSLIIVLQQAAIPISMALSKCFLKAKYTGYQYGGAILVCIGLFFAVLPTMRAPNESQAPLPGSPESYQSLWIFLLLLSNLPACLSSLYKEVALDQEDVDLVYLNTWVAWFQFLLTFPALLPAATIQHIPVSALPGNVLDGTKCYLFGTNSVLEATTAMQPDDCHSGFLYVTLYLVFNVFYNLTSVAIIRYGGANMMWMASTVMVPLANLAFSFDFMPSHQRLGPMDLLGLVVIMSGLIVYRFYPDIHRVFAIEIFHVMEEHYMGIKEHGFGNINMLHRVFHRQHLPVPVTSEVHRDQYRYVSLLAVDLVIAVISFGCGVIIGRNFHIG